MWTLNDYKSMNDELLPNSVKWTIWAELMSCDFLPGDTYLPPVPMEIDSLLYLWRN